MGEARASREVTHHYPIDRLLAFRAGPAADTLRWLAEMGAFL